MIKIKPINIQNKQNRFLAASLIALFAVSMLAPLTFAQVGIPQPEKTAGYISVAPKLVGVGQNATVNLWIWPLPSTYLYSPYFRGYNGVTVTFTKPDGTKDTFMPVDGTGQFVAGQTESIGSIFFNYAPNTAGNWSVSMSMPAQNITDNNGTIQYQACTSNTAYFTVQSDPVLAGLLNGYPWSQLPNSNVFWSYPINSNNREWSQLYGDWTQGNSGSGVIAAPVSGSTSRNWQPYGTAPNTGHIVWKQQIKPGGVVGGDFGGVSFVPTTSSQGRGALVMSGKVFTNIPNVNLVECIDLTTGQVMYTMNGSIIAGVHLPGNAYAQNSIVNGENNNVVLENSYGHDYTSYLYGTSGTTWNYYDPFTGAIVRSLSNCSSGFRLVDGTNLAFGTASGNLTAWDISRVVNNNWPTGIQWTRRLPTSLLGSSPSLFGISADASSIVCRTTNQYWGFSATDGRSLWNLTLTYPVLSNEATTIYGVDDFIIFDPVAATFHCYSQITGSELWTSPSFSDSPWATTWTVYAAVTNDMNNVYLMLPDGTISALSLATGKEIWRSKPIPSTEFTNNVVPFVIGMIEAGGNIYAYAGYSTAYQLNPLPRFSMLVCVNATTGDITYTLNGGVAPAAAAGGYVIGSGIFDGKYYSIGKGQTSTSVILQTNVVTNHATALITGNVLDQSPAQAGTPAVADSSMSEWMDYLHMQNSTLLNNPPQPTGVPVTLSAVDPNGNIVNIGTTTTDSEGNYAVNFVPENIGMYTIKATFAGTDSYYASHSDAHLSVIAATPTSTQQTSTSNSGISETTLYLGIAAIIIVIIIVGAILGLLMIRKRP